MSFHRALEFVLAQEGGRIFHHNPGDVETHSGVIQATYDAWRASRGLDPYPIAEISPAEVDEIYRERYWLAVDGDAYPYPLALVVFDAAVNQGPRMAVRFLQQVAGVNDDGIIGPVTRDAVQRQVEAGRAYELANAVLWRRADHYARIVKARPDKMPFLRWWVVRLVNCHEALEQTAMG
jgi:lysozyme family protein